MNLVRPARQDEAEALASVLACSFPELSRRALWREPRLALAFWRETLQSTWGCGVWWVIEDMQGVPAGMLWLTTRNGDNPLFSADVCRDALGRLGGYWARIALEPLDSANVESGEAYLDWVAVAPQYRRQGYSYRLLEGILAEVSHTGARYLTLDVGAQHQVARELYLKLGFEPVRSVWHPLLTVIYGWGRMIRMRRKLQT